MGLQFVNVNPPSMRLYEWIKICQGELLPRAHEFGFLKFLFLEYLKRDVLYIHFFTRSDRG